MKIVKTKSLNPKMRRNIHLLTQASRILDVAPAAAAASKRRSILRGRTAEIIRMKSTHKSPKTQIPNKPTSIQTKGVRFDDIIEQMKAFSIGTLGGISGSLTGTGGAFVMIPLISAARNNSWKGGLGLSQHQAHGTSLFAVGATGLAGAFGYGIRMGSDKDESEPKNNENKSDVKQKGLVELDIAVALTATAMITARLGAMTSTLLSERVLRKCLGAFMIFIAPLVPGKAYLLPYLESLKDNPDQSKPNAKMHLQEDEALHSQQSNTSQFEKLLPASVIGIFSGFLSGILGVGGGTVVVPALVLTTDMSHHSAIGTSLCAMVLPAMIGTYTHAKRGNVNWRVGALLALGSSVGAFVGGREVGIHLEEDVLRGGFGILMLVLGIRTWRK